jgi:hypothetical protein
VLDDAPDPLQLLAGSDDIGEFAGSDEDRAFVRALLDEGFVVLAVKSDSDSDLFWRFDPSNGDVLGLLSTGEGGTASEYLKSAGSFLAHPTTSLVWGAGLAWKGCTGQWSPAGLSHQKIAACSVCAAIGAIGAYITFGALRTAASGVSSGVRLGEVAVADAYAVGRAQRALAEAIRTGTNIREAERALALARLNAEGSALAIRAAEQAAVSTARTSAGVTVGSLALCAVGGSNL